MIGAPGQPSARPAGSIAGGVCSMGLHICMHIFLANTYASGDKANEEVSPMTTQRSGWAQEQQSLLMEQVRKARQSRQPLQIAFEAVAERTGRKSASVRNYYYTHLRGQMDAPTPFELFTPEQVEALLGAMLTGQAQGRSVRAIALEMAGQDQKGMLRLQNKYRSLIKHHRDQVEAVMARLEQAGESYVNPYAPPEVEPPAEPAEPVTDPGQMLINHLAGIAQDLQALDGAGDSLIAALHQLTHLAANRRFSKRKAEQYDRLTVQYDLLLIQMKGMARELDACQGQLEQMRQQMDARQKPYEDLYTLCRQWRDSEQLPPLMREQLGAALSAMG